MPRDLLRKPSRRARRAGTALNPASTMTAAAKILAPTRADAPAPEAWHPDAWFMRDNTGELRHAETWLGNSMGQARLVAARRRSPGAEPEILPDNHPAQELMAELAGGVGGQAALLRSWGTYLLTPGVGYMCGFNPRNGGGFTWQVRSAGEIRLGSRTSDRDGRPVYEVQTGDGANEFMPLEDGIVVKVHRPDPRHHWRPDSPVRGALGILSELFTLTQAIQATAVSRLAGAGVFAIPQEIDFPVPPDAPPGTDGFTAFLAEFMANVTKPIHDRSSAAAYVPFVFKGKGEFLKYLQHIKFSTPFDEHSIKLREELLGRLATAMDMPAPALTGEQENHWGKAMTAEEGVKIHVRPNLDLVCDGITRGYLLPGLATVAQQRGDMLDLPFGDPGMLAQALQAEDLRDGATGDHLIAWYTLDAFTTKPDKSDDVTAAYDRYEAGGEALRAETGLSDVQPPDNGEVRRRLLLKVAEPGGDATLQRAALIELGVFKEDQVPLPAAGTPPGAGPEEPEEPEPEVGATPESEPDDPAPSEDPAPSPVRPAAVPVAADVGLVTMADLFVSRALERAGNRLRNVTKNRRTLDPRLDQPPQLMHTACNVAAMWAPEKGDLLEGAWDRVPDYAHRFGLDAATLTAALDRYVRELIRTQTVHDWDLLEAYLSAPPSPAEAVLAAARRAS